MGSPGIINDRTPSHFGMDDLTTERKFDSYAKWEIDVLGLFLTHYPWVLVHRALYIRSNGAAIKCPYCILQTCHKSGVRAPYLFHQEYNSDLFSAFSAGIVGTVQVA